jgi:hypothetical protein
MLQFLFRQLREWTNQYSLNVEQAVFSGAEPKFRFVLSRWNRNPADKAATSMEFICEHTDIEQMIDVLTILVSVEKEKVMERRVI